SSFYFWNAGTETLRQDEVVRQRPFQLIAKNGAVFLEHDIIENLNPSNNFDLRRNQTKDKLTITFDFMDKGDGIHVTLVHTCTSPEDIGFEGEFMGAGKPLSQSHRLQSLSKFRKRTRILSVVLLVITFGLIMFQDYQRFGEIPYSASSLFSMTCGFIFGR